MPQSPRRPFDPSVEKRALRRSSPLDQAEVMVNKEPI
jgi:hypothetical protein